MSDHMDNLRRIQNAYIAMNACENDWGKQFWLGVIKRLQRKTSLLH